jgi:hypothetical protein
MQTYPQKHATLLSRLSFTLRRYLKPRVVIGIFGELEKRSVMPVSPDLNPFFPEAASAAG